MSSQSAISFGTGVLIGTPSGANPSPIDFGFLQSVSLNFDFTEKHLMGQRQFPVAVARGAGKVTGKASFAEISAATMGTLFFNSTPSTGQDLIAYQEAGTIPTTPFTITVSNSATWATDLGVIFSSTGIALKRVASAPTTGQYSVAAGVYTFAAADTGKAVLISYGYTNASTGNKIIMTSNLLGVTPTFQLDLLISNPNVLGAQGSLRLFNCTSTKLKLDTKTEDFVIPDFEFSCFANSANQIGFFNTAV